MKIRINPFKSILIGVALGLLAPFVWAKTPVVPEKDLIAGSDHARATEIILHVIDSYHYRTKSLDDHLSGQILDNYLSNLDTNRSFFTRDDIAHFETYRHTLDDTLLAKDLEPAFEIFRRYRNRVDERVHYALEILETEFDFTVDEEYRFDRRDAPWPNKNELDEIWRKRVKNDFLTLKLSGKEQEEIRTVLDKRYRRLKTSTYQYKPDDIFQLFINAYTTAIEPHTAYFSPRTSENFDISMSLSLEGIGAVLRGDTDYTEVQSVVPGGPADLSGQLQSEDKIIGVGQGADGEIIDVIGWRLDDVVELIRGPKGTVVRLELLPKGIGLEGPSKIIEITRDEIKLEEQAAKSEILELENSYRIGVIEIPTFYSDFAAQARGERDYKSTTRDVRNILEQLRDSAIDGLIIDLRGNGGGSLAEALEFTGLFIETGPIVQTKDSAGKIDISRDRDPAIAYGGPLAVLVDRSSASASEIFAGAIQDYQRGVIIGEPTFGKGTVQNIVDLNRFTRGRGDYGRLKTTIAQFFRVSGGSNQYKGVVPDIILPTARINSEQGEQALDNALPWDEIRPAKFAKANAPVDHFQIARELHEKRLESDVLFQLLLAEMKLIHKTSQRKTTSLLESRRKLEREQLVKARKKLQNEFRKAQGLEPLEETASDEEYNETEPLDVVLREAARILADLIDPVPVTTSPVTAKRIRKIPLQ